MTRAELATLDATAEMRGGLSRSRVLILGLDLIAREVLGKRRADLVAVRLRAARRGPRG